MSTIAPKKICLLGDVHTKELFCNNRIVTRIRLPPECVEEDSVDILGYGGKNWLRLFMMSFESCDEKGILLVLAFKLGILATRLLTC